MLKNLLHFGERRVIDVAVPRSDIIAFDDAGSFADLVALFREAGHSRIPVFTGSLDEVQGMIHVRDVYAHLADPANGPAIGRASCRERVCQTCRSRWSPYPSKKKKTKNQQQKQKTDPK